MRIPIADSCAFSMHYTRMKLSFPAEASVKANVKSGKEEIVIDKLIAAKRRDLSGKENGKTVKFARGWEITQQAKPGSHQRIIYQAYDRENYYYNFGTSAWTKNFAKCREDLQSIIDSIKFGD